MLSSGKIPPGLLAKMLAKVPPCSDVVVGPGCGEDAAAVRVGTEVLVAAADPVTFAYERAGSYAVYINANDVATRGAVPRYFLATLLAAEGAGEEDIEAVFADILSACERVGASLIGGHTEVTSAVVSTVVCGCMIGEVNEGSLLRTCDARAGDHLIMTESAGLEGAALLARDAADDLAKAGVPSETIDAARSFLDVPGICIVDHARVACDVGGISAMHDPTEGGVAAAVFEIAQAARKRIVICPERIYVRRETAAIARALGLDPLGLISSGCLLICAQPDVSRRILDSLSSLQIPADVIGEIQEGETGVFLQDGRPFRFFERDEIARYYEQKRRSE